MNGLGHGDRALVAAIRKQAARLIHASNLYHTEPAAALAERLVSLSFPAKVFLCNSGTEAGESAIKFARKIGAPQGRSELVAFERSFHGRTLGTLSITWNAKYRAPFEPLVPGVRFCPWDDLAAASAAIGPATAAVAIEPVQERAACGRPRRSSCAASPPCRERGALLVVDEVHCGLGRTGRLFAYQHRDPPDILTLAKPLGGGLPLGAVLLRDELAGGIAVGDPEAPSAAIPWRPRRLAVLERLTAEGFVEEVAGKGTYLLKGLLRIAKKYPGAVAEVRGLGLMVGMELKGPAGPVLKGLREQGVLATKAGDNVLRLLPPLIIKRSEIRTFLAALDAVLQEQTGAAA